MSRGPTAPAWHWALQLGKDEEMSKCHMLMRYLLLHWHPLKTISACARKYTGCGATYCMIWSIYYVYPFKLPALKPPSCVGWSEEGRRRRRGNRRQSALRAMPPSLRLIVGRRQKGMKEEEEEEAFLNWTKQAPRANNKWRKRERDCTVLYCTGGGGGT